MNERDYVLKINKEYTQHEENQYDELKRLDARVKRPAEIFAYCFGIIGSLVLGVGMCLAMKIIFDFMALGIVIGVLGIAMVSVNYFIYKRILKRRKAKYSEDIIRISNALLNM